jgi:hypothetical protein
MSSILTPKLKYEIKELIDERIREKHVTREDFTELKDIVRDLAEAQKRTEIRVEELAREQKELAKAMKGTQEEIKTLAITVDKLARGLDYTRRDLGGVTSTLGFMLENEAYRVLPGILKNRYGIEVKERFLRKGVRSFGIEDEGDINIFGRGIDKKDGKDVVIIGEAKSQLGRDDIDELLDMVMKLKGVIRGEIFLIAVTHYGRESVIKYAKEKGVEVIQSFEW